MVDKNLLTQVAYAKKTGKSRQYINKLVKKGIITLVKGKIDPQRADIEIAECTNNLSSKSKKKLSTLSTRPSGEVDKNNLSYKDALAKKLNYQAENERIKCEKDLGLLVPVDEVSVELEKAIMACRSRILALPNNLAPLLLNIKTIEEAKEILKSGSKECLTELSIGYTSAGKN